MSLVEAGAQGLVRFLGNNLLPALMAGAVAWLAVAVGVRLLDIRHGRLRLCLFLAPPIKSTLVLLGLAPVLPWPREVFRPWAAAAVEPAIMLPLFLVAAGAGVLAQSARAFRERALALRGAEPASDRSPRLAAAYDAVAAVLGPERTRIAAVCGSDPPVRLPALFVTSAPLSSPLVLVDEEPRIVFPAGLIGRLDDAQLRAALAHEVAHLLVRRRLSCTSSEWVRMLTAVSPFALAVAAQLDLEEEKACDDIAVAVTGDAAGYADMLVVGYRYARATGAAPVMATVPRLMGFRPSLAQRIERQLGERPPTAGLTAQRLRFACLWLLLVVVLFTG